MVRESSIAVGDSRTTVVGKIASTNKRRGWENRSDTTEIMHNHAAKMKSDGKPGLTMRCHLNPAIALWLQSTRPAGRVAELRSLSGNPQEIYAQQQIDEMSKL
jgi:hypothetical protein